MASFTSWLHKILPYTVERKLRIYLDRYWRQYKVEDLPPAIYSDALAKKSISFCTNCMNRLYHLRHTVEKNIKANQDYPNVEFVLMNYNSGDGMHEWVQKHLMNYIESGILNYYYTGDPQYFHMSKAKNLAHRLAKGDIVCNLDGDNFTGMDFAFYINYMFNKCGDEIILRFNKPQFSGTEGRIVLTRKNFEKLGGYDESFYPAGYQDFDLIDRAKAMGLAFENIEIENFLRYLSNTIQEKSTGLSAKKIDFHNYRELNRLKSVENLNAGKLISNTGTEWGKVKVYKNFSTEPFLY
ncbi:MAG TPA: glycosyltransferase family A protein [Ohtaekwangia sp.]